LSSFVFDFMGQIVTNNVWLKTGTTVDDYVGMVIILVGMFCSKMQVFG